VRFIQIFVCHDVGLAFFEVIPLARSGMKADSDYLL